MHTICSTFLTHRSFGASLPSGNTTKSSKVCWYKPNHTVHFRFQHTKQDQRKITSHKNYQENILPYVIKEDHLADYDLIEGKRRGDVEVDDTSFILNSSTLFANFYAWEEHSFITFIGR